MVHGLHILKQKALQKLHAWLPSRLIKQESLLTTVGGSGGISRLLSAIAAGVVVACKNRDGCRPLRTTCTPG